MERKKRISIKDIPNYSKNLPFIENILSGIAKYITWLLVKTPVTGTWVTIASALFALLGSMMMMPGIYWISIAGMICFDIFILLDHVDGQVARFKKQSGPHGIYLDSRIHFIVEPIFFIGLGFGAFYNAVHAGGYALLSFLYLMSGFGSAVFYLMRQTLKTGDLGIAPIRKLKREKSVLGKMNYIFFDMMRINNPVSFMMIAVVFNVIGPMLAFYCLAFLLNLIMSLYKTYNNLKVQGGKHD